MAPGLATQGGRSYGGASQPRRRDPTPSGPNLARSRLHCAWPHSGQGAVAEVALPIGGIVVVMEAVSRSLSPEAAAAPPRFQKQQAVSYIQTNTHIHIPWYHMM